MPKLNRFLVASIVSDIKECVHITSEIYSLVGEIEHLSWKFPTKTARSINAMEIVEEHEGTAGEFYILLLELAYDRFHFFLRLAVEFMDKHSFVENFLAEVTQMGRPPQMSLASLLRLIWNRLKTLLEATSGLVRARILKETEHRRISRGSQASTEVGHCESCSIASDMILRAISAIERAFAENELISAAATERKRSRDDIYESTQWALMSRLTKAIGTDVESALAVAAERKRELQKAKQKYEGKLRDLRAEVSKTETRAERLGIEKAEVEEALENAKARSETVEGCNLSLQQENRTLRVRIEDLRQQLTSLTDGNSVLQSQVGVLAESKLELVSAVSGLEKEVAVARNASAETERNFRLLLTELKNENDSTKLEYEKKIATLRQEIAEIRSTRGGKRGKEDENAREGDSNEEPREGNILTPGVDPEVDMTRQLMSNRARIETLTRQNERLSKTLSRLRNYRLTQQTTSNARDK